jgi:dTDP-4-dehydrorhamnose reductase/UDP-glucose 4-epimerase
VLAVSHGDLDRPDLLDGIGVVINFARNPASSGDGYQPDESDPDDVLARRIGDRDIAYVMLSTRKVYRPSDAPLGETSPTAPGDAYGRNKLAAERRLIARLGERLTILRLANIFGDERLPGRRTFFAMMLNRLARENQIRYDMSPFVERDFLPADILADLLLKIAASPPGGVMNIGSGIALPTGRLAMWLIEGFGGGELSIIDPAEKDPFVLAIDRLSRHYGRPCTRDDIRNRCLELGQAVKSASA